MNGVRLTIIHRLDEDAHARIDRLIDHAADADGYDPLSEHKRMGLARAVNPPGDTGPGGNSRNIRDGRAADEGTLQSPSAFAAVLATRVGSGDLMGYAQLDAVATTGEYDVELVLHPRYRDPSLGLGDSLLGASLTEAVQMSDADARGIIRYWASHATPAHDALATSHGLRKERDLIQMRLPLSVGEAPPDVVVRTFVAGVDEDAWLYVNNRAFASHPEQGNWTRTTMLEREAEPWFDPDGLLLHERDGRVVASCWTKVHAHTEPPMGEIYVISVDPEYRGHGLGRSLTRAGLDQLARAGLRVGMLYVDADNPAALSLYRSMGFTEDHTDRAYIGTLG